MSKDSQTTELEALTRCCGVSVKGSDSATPQTVQFLARKELATLRHPDDWKPPQAGLTMWVFLVISTIMLGLGFVAGILWATTH
jgi:hypothetical protein